MKNLFKMIKETLMITPIDQGPYVRGVAKLTEKSADVIHDWLKDNLELTTETSITATRVVLKLRGEEISAVTIHHS